MHLQRKQKMRGKHLYEYAVIRVMPRVERGEFINVGIIVFCKKEKFIRMLSHINEKKLACFSSELGIDELKKNLDAFQKIAEGEKNCGEIAQMDAASRFRWLTAVRSASIQTSRPHPGFSDDLENTANRLLREMVL